MLEHLRLHLSTNHNKTENYHQICQKIYGCIQKINNTRSTEGVVNPLVVTVSIVEDEYKVMGHVPGLTVY